MNKLWLATLTFFISGTALACSDNLDYEFRKLAGKDTVHLCEAYEGQVLLVVNVASKCGYTPQYDGLEKLYAEYREEGFAVLGFPSNDFMGQEPGTEEEIQEFCRLTYGVEFPMFEKTTVKDQNTAHPFYQNLAAKTDGLPKWNFHKYLLGRDGSILRSFPSRTEPYHPELLEALQQALATGSGGDVEAASP